MNRQEILHAYREEVNKLRGKINELEVESIEKRASDDVRKWREKFDAVSSKHMEHILNDIEKRKQSKVSHVADELRHTLEDFQLTMLERLDELDLLISKIKLDDEIQMDYIEFELNSKRRKLDCLHMDILVQPIDASKRRRSLTTIAENTVEIIKVFEFKERETSPPTSPSAVAAGSSDIMTPLMDFVHSASSAGASYYNTDILRHEKHF